MNKTILMIMVLIGMISTAAIHAQEKSMEQRIKEGAKSRFGRGG